MEFEFPVAIEGTIFEKSVPEEFRGLYAATEDGEYRINDTLAKKLDVSGLKSAIDKERMTNKELRKAQEQWKDFGKTPDEIRASIADFEKKLSDASEGKLNLQKIKEETEQRVTEVTKEKDTQIDKMRSALHTHLVLNEINAALAEEGGNPKLLAPIIERQVKVVEEEGKYNVRVVDGEGDARSDGFGGLLGIKGLVKELKKSEDYGVAFKKDSNGGTGMPPKSQQQSHQKAKDQMTSTEKISMGLNSRK